MQLDIRIPIGAMFVLLGLILAGFGLATTGSEMYARSLSININLVWGLVMLGFGALMLLLAWRGYRRTKATPGPSPKEKE